MLPEMLEALVKELSLKKDEGSSLNTIYFGGGTPSLFSIEQLKEIFAAIHQNFILKDDAEITLEANPEDLSVSYLKGLKTLGVNRLSVGVQSFKDADLQLMNRKHRAQESVTSIKSAQDTGFENISLDLIYALPGQHLADWQANIDIFLSLKVPHLSAYALTVEPKTALQYFVENGKINLPKDTSAEQHYTFLNTQMKEAGFEHYEISNFAKPNFISQHNSAYWQGKKYIGIGPSAHSFDGKNRMWNIAHNTKYIKSLQKNILPETIEMLSAKMRYNEYLMTGLRTSSGVDIAYIKSNFERPFYPYFLKAATIFLEQGLLAKNANNIKIPEAHWFVADGIIADLFWVD